MASAFLDDRGVVRVEGEDARSFLQGLVTCNMDHVSLEAAGFGALLSPQGKILFDFLIVEDKDGFLLDTPMAQIADLIKRLSLYRLRAKVTLRDLSGAADPALEALGVLALWDGEPGEGLVYDDPRHVALGRRSILSRREARAAASATADDYEGHRIRCGVPKGGVDFAFGETFPHDADMDLIHGVDFKKGCYIGQEVVSRVEHRGTARKRIIPVHLRGPSPGPGVEIRAGDLVVGTMGSAAGDRGLAMIRTDRAEEAIAAGTPLIAGTSILELMPADVV
ncbi:MAG: folate-binding protein [Beijerinckiaceae bacterium]|nr:folate-binding protein [Beijerinckiaceae bacterium]MDO9443375.1 folate-binding protein [Beijerinckiaceae bacterium]